jgi:hypothetical protein
MPWWLSVSLAALIGWVSLNLYLHFYWEQLDDLLAAAGGVDRAPQELVDEWQNDGGPKTFTFLFAWLYGLVYFAVWSLVYAIAIRVRSSRSPWSAAV